MKKTYHFRFFVRFSWISIICEDLWDLQILWSYTSQLEHDARLILTGPRIIDELKIENLNHDFVSLFFQCLKYVFEVNSVFTLVVVVVAASLLLLLFAVTVFNVLFYSVIILKQLLLLMFSSNLFVCSPCCVFIVAVFVPDCDDGFTRLMLLLLIVMMALLGWCCCWWLWWCKYYSWWYFLWLLSVNSFYHRNQPLLRKFVSVISSTKNFIASRPTASCIKLYMCKFTYIDQL